METGIEIIMKTGIELIAEERWQQINKHGHTVESDVQKYSYGNLQLTNAAMALSVRFVSATFIEATLPQGWDPVQWRRMMGKPYIERLAIAGAFIAAEIDRVNKLSENANPENDGK